MSHDSDDFVNGNLWNFNRTESDQEVLLTWRGTIPLEWFEVVNEDIDFG